MDRFLDQLDLSKSIKSNSDYKKQLKKLQLQLLYKQRELQEKRQNCIVVLEGPDASGKGGVTKRIVEKLDPRHIRVYSTHKPSIEEAQHHYLWRFWNKIPAYGDIAIFDRSWYGRVLVERVEQFASREEWSRAYEEINSFEKTLADNGTIFCKFYLHISKDEQLKRFEARQADPYKHWKITDEDWRNREKWDEHNAAAEAMFTRTNTEHAPWNLIEANHKWFARLKALKLLIKTLEQHHVGAPITT